MFSQSAKREKAKAAYLKFLSHWQKMASAQALCRHGLGEAELLQMTDKPTALIQRLYEHPSITDTDFDTGQNKLGENTFVCLFCNRKYPKVLKYWET